MLKNVKTLLDMRIDPQIKGIPGGQIKLVKVRDDEGDHKIAYAVWVDDNFLGGFDADDDQQAVFMGMAKIHALMVFLSREKEGDLERVIQEDQKIRLFIDPDPEGGNSVSWYGLCGYSSVDFIYGSAEDAALAFSTFLLIKDVEVD